jgi:mRNA interferase RelE/StbE
MMVFSFTAPTLLESDAIPSANEVMHDVPIETSERLLKIKKFVLWLKAEMEKAGLPTENAPLLDAEGGGWFFDVGRLTANVRANLRTALETHLRHEPEKTSRSRIKRLRGLLRPQYRLRVGEVRVFYDVSGTTVEVLAIVAKSEAESWLAHFANPE